MARIKRGITTHAKHKKVLLANKGYRMTKSSNIRVAKEAMLHAGEYAFSGRKLRKRDMRRLWVSRINSAVQEMDLNYSRFMHALKKSDIILDRKILADLAISDPNVFRIIVDKVKKQVN